MYLWEEISKNWNLWREKAMRDNFACAGRGRLCKRMPCGIYKAVCNRAIVETMCNGAREKASSCNKNLEKKRGKTSKGKTKKTRRQCGIPWEGWIAGEQYATQASRLCKGVGHTQWSRLCALESHSFPRIGKAAHCARERWQCMRDSWVREEKPCTVHKGEVPKQLLL